MCCPLLYVNTRYASQPQSKRASGTKMRNFHFCVLCRKKCMPKSAPGAPPRKALSKSVRSGMRQEWRTALLLSRPKSKKPIQLSAAIQMRNTLCSVFKCMPLPSCPLISLLTHRLAAIYIAKRFSQSLSAPCVHCSESIFLVGSGLPCKDKTCLGGEFFPIDISAL